MNEVEKQGRFEDIKDSYRCCLYTKNRATEKQKCNRSFAYFSNCTCLFEIVLYV